MSFNKTLLLVTAFCILNTLLFYFFVIYPLESRINVLEQQTCNCTVNYGGHNMSVEDAFERAGEGLTADQADEVKILIEEYCK